MPVKLTVALPDLPSTVPVKTPAPKKEPFPEDRRITVSCPAKVPAKSPCVTIVSVCVTIRFPSTILTPVLVAEVVDDLTQCPGDRARGKSCHFLPMRVLGP